jgi:glycosyltransferase involved in cell wall biosynthesis
MTHRSESHKLAILTQHPIPYHAALYREYAQSEKIDLTVFFCSRAGIESTVLEDMGNVEVQWDIPLLNGYESKFLTNVAPDEASGFFSLINPGIVSELIQGEFDALSVHGHNFLTYHFAILTARMIGVPVFMSADTHLLLDRPPLKRMLRGPLLGAFYSQIYAFLANGTKNRQFFRSFGIPAEQIFDVPYTVNNEFFQSNALDSQEARQFKESIGLDPSTPVVLYVSKFQARKRPEDLIRAFDRLISSGIDSQLVYVGDGEEFDKVKNYAFRHGLADKVLFAGFQKQVKLPKWYSIGDVFVLPSENEPWAVVVNEAMNFGLPVITTKDVGSAYDLVEQGETGFRYAVGDIDALTGHLQSLLVNQELRAHMSKKALNRIDNWSYREAVEGMEQALESTEDYTPTQSVILKMLRSLNFFDSKSRPS